MPMTSTGLGVCLSTTAPKMVAVAGRMATNKANVDLASRAMASWSVMSARCSMADDDSLPEERTESSQARHEGYGWVNWSGLASVLEESGDEFRRFLGRLLPGYAAATVV